MKKLINDPRAVVDEMIEGLVAAYPCLRRIPGHTVLVRADLPAAPERAVAVISGGGSGHEPAHAGYVGAGMLSAAVAGDVFTSPNPDAVLTALRAAAGPRGAVLIVKNYTGDRLNFGLAAEMARAEGIPVDVVLVADDVALAGSAGKAGRRGIAGTVLVHKVAGAVAATGASRAEVAAAARSTAAAVRTMGVALSACTVPAAGRPGFELAANEIELGLGIHGEPGVRRGPLESADALVERLLTAILADLGPAVGGQVVLLVNNLGATPTMELAIVARRAVALLQERGLAVERVYLGTFLSALDMAGVSLSVLPVDAERLARLDAPTAAPAWPSVPGRPRLPRTPSVEPAFAPTARGPLTGPRTSAGMHLRAAIERATQALIAAAPRLTELDQVVGDGDLGISLERGARAVLQELADYPLDDPAATLHALGMTLQRSVGGSSGPFYGAFFLRAAATLREGQAADLQRWASAFQAGCTAVSELGGAQPGERTMLDALQPAAAAFAKAVAAGQTASAALQAAAAGAAAGATAAEHMRPVWGRSSYLGERALGHPDPGATAIALWLAAVAAS
jgi:dihydroxyacetone kinase